MLVTATTTSHDFAASVPLPRAVLWDMDGTLIDSEPFWMDAETILVHEHGGVWTHEDALQLVGNGLETSAEILQSRGVRLSPAEIIETLVDSVIDRLRHEIPWRPGARELLGAVRDAGIPTALVTMSTMRLASVVVEGMGFTAFDELVTYEQVTKPKPHPEPYLEGLRRLGVDAEHAVALEDSVPGVASAVASGVTTIAVPFHVPLPPSPAYTSWTGLEGRTVADLAGALATSRASAGLTS